MPQKQTDALAQKQQERIAELQAEVEELQKQLGYVTVRPRLMRFLDAYMQ